MCVSIIAEEAADVSILVVFNLPNDFEELMNFACVSTKVFSICCCGFVESAASVKQNNKVQCCKLLNNKKKKKDFKEQELQPRTQNWNYIYSVKLQERFLRS